MKQTLLYRGGTFIPQTGKALACKIGLNNAIILQTIANLCDAGNGRTLRDGKRWVYGSYDAWHEMFFTYFSKATLIRNIQELEKMELLISCQPESGVSRRKYYRIGEQACSMLMADFEEENAGKDNIGDQRFYGPDMRYGDPITDDQNDNVMLSKCVVPLTKDSTKDNTLREPSVGSPGGEQEGFSLDQEASPTPSPQLIPSKQESSTFTQSGEERSASEQKKEKVAKKERKPRERNPIIDAIAAIDGPLDQVLPSKWSLYAKIAKEILSVCPEITTEEINKRVARYRAIFPTAAVTSTAIASHWAKLSVATKEERREANIRYI